ncbi:MAG: hypothetical protein IPN19_00060 [Elusimicrobia bacterium]|nr:hypothetical protein [Elusimicrobiota bacterium]
MKRVLFMTSILFCVGYNLTAARKNSFENGRIYKVNFSYSRHIDERKRAWADDENDEAYKAMAALGLDGGPQNIGIDKFDVNGDRILDVFVFDKNPWLGGSHGQATSIYLVDKHGGWKLIFDAVTYGELNILSKRTNGFYDLDVVGQDNHMALHENIWKWNGIKYDFSKSEAH